MSESDQNDAQADGGENPCAVAWETAFEKQGDYCGTGEMMVEAEQLLGVDASGADFDDVMGSGLSESICTNPDATRRRMWVLGRVFWANQDGQPLIERYNHDVRAALDAGLREADGVCLDLASSGGAEPEPEPEPEADTGSDEQEKVEVEPEAE